MSSKGGDRGAAPVATCFPQVRMSSKGGDRGAASGIGVFSDKMGWRETLKKISLQTEIGGSQPGRVRTGPVGTAGYGTGRLGPLAPQRAAEQPSTPALRKREGMRRSKSAEPGSMINLHGSITRPETCDQVRLLQHRDTMPVEQKPQDMPDLAVFSTSRRLLRKPLPVVVNRADPNELAAFYSELRDALETGKARFKDGVDDRAHQRQNAAKRNRMSKSTDNAEPMSHPDFMLSVDALVMDLGHVEDPDSDDALEERLALFEQARRGWIKHADSVRLDLPSKSDQSDLKTDSNSRDKSCTKNSELCENDTTEYLQPQFPTTTISRVDQLRHEGHSDFNLVPSRPNTSDSERLEDSGSTEKLKHENAFKILNISGHPEVIDLRNRPDVVKPKVLEAIAVLCEGGKGVKPLHSLLVSQCAIGYVGIQKMTPILNSCAALKTLDLSENSLCPQGALSLAETFRKLTRLETLVLDNNPFGPRGTRLIMSSVRGCVNMKSISMAKCEVSCQGASYLAQAMHPAWYAANASFFSLDPSHASRSTTTTTRDDLVMEKRQSLIRDTNFTAIGAGIPNFYLGSCLTALRLHNNNIGPDGAELLLDELSIRCHSLEVLDLSLNFINAFGQDQRGAISLSRCLKTATSLVQLNLSDCQLQPEGGAMVIEGLMAKTVEMQHEIKEGWAQLGKSTSTNDNKIAELTKQIEQKEIDLKKYVTSRKLKSLWLARNNFGTSGIEMLGHARQLFPSLTELDIGSNDMTGNVFNVSHAACVDLCFSFKLSKSMKTLNLRDNRLGGPSIENDNLQPTLNEICSALTKMGAITQLDLSKNQIGELGSKTLASALDVLRSLKILDLSSNQFGSDGMKSLVPAFRGALEEINLSDNGIGPDGIGALAARVPFLPKLTKIDLSGNRLTQALKEGRQAVDGGKKKFILSSIAKDVGSVGLSEAKKQLLMAGGAGDGSKRGLGAFAAACGEHLLQLKEIVLQKNVQAGYIRTAEPSLDLTGVDFSIQDFVLVAEMLKRNRRVMNVDLTRNDLQDSSHAIAEWMKQATQLQRINLSTVKLGDTGVENVAVGLIPLCNLKVLVMSKNNIGTDGVKFLSPALRALNALEVLDLSGNPLTVRHVGHSEGDNYYSSGVEGLAKALAVCVTLVELDLSNCALRDEGAIVVASALQKLTALHKVVLVENSIEFFGEEALGQALRSCRHITTADNIHSDEIYEGKHIKISALYQVPFIANVFRRHAVSKIDLSNNALGRSQDSLCDLMEGLGQLRSLTDLNLSSNRPFSRKVCMILSASLDHMTSLRLLKLADNDISGDGADSLMCTLVRLFRIEGLDISKNRFTTFPITISISCPNLWKMDLTDNPWKCPAPALMKKTTTQICDTLNLEFVNGRIDREMALIFIGRTDVGKSCVIRALMSEEHKAPHIGHDNRTQGIEQHHWKPLADTNTPLYNIYDFAGLEIYEEIQINLCLLRRAIYCLVWRPFRRLKADEHQSITSQPFYRIPGHGMCTQEQVLPLLHEQVIPWIDKLHRRVPGFSVFLIATHLGRVEEEDLLWQTIAVKEALQAHVQGLHERFSYISSPKLLNSGDTVWVDSITGANVTLLQETLIRETENLPYYGEVMPKSWMEMRQSINRLRSLHKASLRERKKKKEKEHVLHAATQDQAPLKPIGPPEMFSDNAEVEDSKYEYIEPKQRWQSMCMRMMLRTRIRKMMRLSNHGSGFMWIGHFTNLIKNAGIDFHQRYALMRYFHDSGWIRCYGFDDTKVTKFRSNEHNGGLEMLDPYRSSGFKLATNSYAVLHRKDSDDRPTDFSEEIWSDMCDTVILDLAWFFDMAESIITHDGTRTIVNQKNIPHREEAIQLYSTGELQWCPGAPNLLGKLWRNFLTEHDFRRICNVFLSKGIFKHEKNKRNIQTRGKTLLVPALIKTAPQSLSRVTSTEGFPETFLTFGRLQSIVPSNDTAAQCSVFLSYESNRDTSVANPDPNFATCLLPLLKYTVENMSHSSVLMCEDYETDEELDAALSKCSIIIVCVSDAHFRSMAGRKHICGALNKGLHVIGVVLPNYSVWPPSLKDGCWWDAAVLAGGGRIDPVIKYLHYAFLADLSLDQFHVYFSILQKLQDAVASGEIDPQDPEVVWNSVKGGEYDEEDERLHDAVKLQSEMLQLSKDALLEYRQWCLDCFVQTIESVALRVSQLFYRKSCFIPELCADEINIKLAFSKRIVGRWQTGNARMETAKKDEETVAEQLRIEKAKAEAMRQHAADKEQRIIRENAELWHTDPLHAKLGLLKEIANVQIGLNVQPRWQHRDQIIEKSKLMAQQVLDEHTRAKGVEQADDQDPAHHGAHQENLDRTLQDLENMDQEFGNLAVDAAHVANMAIDSPSGVRGIHNTANSIIRSEFESRGMLASSHSVRTTSSEDCSQDEFNDIDPFFNLVGPSPSLQTKDSETDSSNFSRRTELGEHEAMPIPTVRKPNTTAAESFLAEALTDEPLVGRALSRGLTLGSVMSKAGPLKIKEETDKMVSRMEEEKK